MWVSDYFLAPECILSIHFSSIPISSMILTVFFFFFFFSFHLLAHTFPFRNIFTPMQAIQDHNGDINLNYIFCMENKPVRQRNLCRPRPDFRKLVYFYPVGVHGSRLITHSHLFLYRKRDRPGVDSEGVRGLS